MTLTAIIVLLAVLAVAWRLVKLAIRLILLAVFAGAVLWYATTHSGASTGSAPAQTARLAHVADGDTLTVITDHGRERVRLLGIDAPEASSTRFGHPDCAGRAATRSLRRLAHVGARVRLTTDPDSGDTRPVRPAARLCHHPRRP
jgi:endonuclease YncB( thermonuclease family)